MKKNNPESLALISSKMLLLFSITVHLSACVNDQGTLGHINKSSLTPGLICQSAERYKNKVIGDGHCVSLIKHCTNAPQTSAWSPGVSVLGSKLPTGTIIATFKNGRYPNKTGYHAAVYIKQDHQGIWVWDQWLGKPTHKRLIRIRDDNARPANSAQHYKVVQIK